MGCTAPPSLIFVVGTRKGNSLIGEVVGVIEPFIIFRMASNLAFSSSSSCLAIASDVFAVTSSDSNASFSGGAGIDAVDPCLGEPCIG